MFKFAHSLSIAFGFMVACVQTLCGADKVYDTSNCGLTSETRSVAKIYSQIFKNLASKKQTSEESLKEKSQIDSYIFDNPFGDSPQIFSSLLDLQQNFSVADFIVLSELNIAEEIGSISLKLLQSHPIRAPSIA